MNPMSQKFAFEVVRRVYVSDHEVIQEAQGGVEGQGSPNSAMFARRGSSLVEFKMNTNSELT